MESINSWSVIPFLFVLIGVAVFPHIFPRFWNKEINKIFFSFAVVIPVIVYLIDAGYSSEVTHQILYDYIPFIILVFALFVITSGIHIRLNLRPTPIANTFILLIGFIFASIMGTTGAALLLVRPLLNMNKKRINKAHLMLFLIALVANCGGLLTPLGDPPLFMLFLRGVPFNWFLGLFPIWMFAGLIMLLIYYLLDSYFYKKEIIKSVPDYNKNDSKFIICKGGINFLFLIAIVLTVAYINKHYFVLIGDKDANIFVKFSREIILLILAVVSWLFTDRNVRVSNHFSWSPFNEVAILFFAIFATMTPALLLLQTHAKEIGLTSPSDFYYATGFLSSFLDNTPTAVAFYTLAMEFSDGFTDIVGGVRTSFLVAISVGAVFFGSMTYIGNGPNFMIKSIAENEGIKMPGFLKYILKFSIPILLPIYILIQLIFIK